MKNCIVTLSNDRGNYLAAQDRLVKSLVEVGFSGDILAYRSEGEVNAPPHISNPYAFKVYCFNRAVELGYTNILYLDSSVYAIKNPNPLFDIIKEEGYIMQEAGAYVGDWCNDEALNYFDLTREQAKKMPMYGNAGLLGLDLSQRNPEYPTIAKSQIKPCQFFVMWYEAMTAGMFKGSWDNHRHDMTCGSIIANQLGMKYKPGDQILQYAAPEDPVLNDTIIFKAQGL